MEQSKKRVKPKLSSKARLHNMDIPLIGLTGGIASGKSTVASLLAETAKPVISADKLVKQLYEQEQTKSFIQQNFPQCIENKQINFSLLRQKAFQDESTRTTLEAFLHPRLPMLFKETAQIFPSPDYIIYDIPLLFEKSLENQFDLVVCVYCPPEQQKRRLLDRDNIDEMLASAMIKSQMDINIKKSKADAVIDNSKNMEQLSTEVKAFIQQYL